MAAPVVWTSGAWLVRDARSSRSSFVRPFAESTGSASRPASLLWPLLTSRSTLRGRRPFRREARSPQVRILAFVARPADLRHRVLIAEASRSLARSPHPAPPLSASCSSARDFAPRFFQRRPHGQTLSGFFALRFARLVCDLLVRGLSPPGQVHAGHTKREGSMMPRLPVSPPA